MISIKSIELQLQKKYEEQQQLVFKRKFTRGLYFFSKLLPVLLTEGIVATYYYYQQLLGARVQNWSKIKRSIEKRKLTEGACVKHNFLDNFVDLYRYFLWFDSFSVAMSYREKALDMAIKKQQEVPYLLPEAVNAALEMRNPSLAMEILNGKQDKVIGTSLKRRFELMTQIFLGNSETVQCILKPHLNASDRKFSELIRGRSVAVVGPAVPNVAVGNEIDDYDVIVRTNFRVDQDLPAEIFGSKTDVSYYNHAAWTSRQESVLEAAKTLRWINLKGRDDDKLLNMMLPSSVDKSRVFFQADDLFFSGNPMAIQNILYDLLHFSPKKIKLFCSSFYKSGNGYNSGYHSYLKKSHTSDYYSQSLRIHDPFSGFIFVKNLLNAGLIKVDEITGDTLNLSCESYAKHLDDNYGSTTLA